MSIRFFKYLWQLAKNNLLISFLSISALISSFWNTPNTNMINWQVIALLFNLMIVVAVFQRYKLLDWVAVRILNYARDERNLTRIMIGLCMVASMFITNDVALITFVPITLLIALKVKINVVRLIVLQTLAANLGSSFTPLGNPQNLYLYTFYHYTWWQFLSQSCLIVLIGTFFLWRISKSIENQPFSLALPRPCIIKPFTTIVFVILFLLILFSVGHLIDYRLVTLAIVIIAAILVPKVMIAIDYSLLITFVLFFIVVGNISQIPIVATEFKHLFAGQWESFFGAILLSQAISNVPVAVMLSPFTDNWMALLWGVNVGSMGTLIASMASLISYRIYLRHFPLYSNGYLKLYFKYNLLGLAVFIPICSLVLFLSK